MESAILAALEPRKTPRQARSTTTVEAIFEAAIQVLLTDGASRLTTTRVAERAGVSVGTMYQYFPHKRSLLFAVLKRHLEAVEQAVELACRRYAGQSIETISDGVTTAFLDAKTARVDASRALYLVSSELDTAELIDGVASRICATISTLLSSAADARFEDVRAVAFMIAAALAGIVRVVLEREADPAMLHTLRTELPILCRAYLATAKTRSALRSVE